MNRLTLCGWMRVVHTSPAFLLVTSPSLRSTTRNHPGSGTGRGCGCGWVGGDFTMYSSPSSSLFFAPTRTTFNLRWERGWMIIPNPPSVARPPPPPRRARGCGRAEPGCASAFFDQQDTARTARAGNVTRPMSANKGLTDVCPGDVDYPGAEHRRRDPAPRGSLLRAAPTIAVGRCLTLSDEALQ